jgi:hypothetical protein
MVMRSPFISLVLAAGILLASAAGPARAQSEASADLSLLPAASVVGAASAGAVSAGAASAAVVAVPAALSVGGAVLVVKAVESTARGTVYVLERLSDGARCSVEVAGVAASGIVASVGTSVAVSVIGTGVLLSAAGEVLAFVPNELGRALLHNERLSRTDLR